MPGKLSLFAILLLMFSCKNSDTQTEAKGGLISTAFDSVEKGHITKTLAKEQQGKREEQNAELQKSENKILGSWQNDDDAKDILIFQKGIYISHYEHSKDTFKFTFSNTSCNEIDSANPQSQSLYLSAQNSRNVSLCYEVTKLDNDSFALMFLDNGNILSYHRIK